MSPVRLTTPKFPTVVATSGKPPVDWTSIAKVLGLLVLTCLCYWPSLRSSFLWDDDVWILCNPLVRAPGGWWKIWFSTEVYDYLPLIQTSFRLEWPWWGEDPLPYRVDNALLHLGNALLLWRLLSRLRVPGAWYGALLFAIHPVTIASVAWISERKNTLSMAFYLASLLGWVAADDLPPGRRRTGLLATSLLAFVLALLSKASVVMLPCVLLLLTWWRRGNVRWRDGWRTAPYFALSLVAGLVTIWFQHHHTMAPDWERTAAPPGTRFLVAARSILFYLDKALVPTRLAMIYPRWHVDGAPDTALLLAPLAVAALLGAAWWARTRWGRGPFTALGYFVLTVLPASGLLTMAFSMYSFVSDQFVYVPLLGLLAGGAALLTRVSERGGVCTRRIVTGGMILLVGGCVAASRQRAEEFSSSRNLWEANVRAYPGCAPAHNSLGLAYLDAGQLPAAEGEFRRALALDPGLSSAATNLAGNLQREHRWSEAAAAYEAALRDRPDAKNFNNLGAVWLELGENDRARDSFRTAVRMRPDLFSAHLNLSKLASALHDDATAAAELRACLRTAPDDVPILVALAALEIKAGVPAGGDAVVLAERARRISEGTDPVALGTLSRAYLAAGRRADAAATGERAMDAARRGGQPELAAEIGRYVAKVNDLP